MNMNYDVIIIGAGPVGLSLALNLGQNSKSVLVLEKDPELHKYSRAPAIWPRTQEILNDLGVMGEIETQGIIHKKLQMTDADSGKENAILELPLYELENETKYPRLVILPQEKTEKILLQKITGSLSNVKVLFSSEFKNLFQDKEGVSVSYFENGEEKTSTAKFVVGCDGAHSAVREALGLHLDGITYANRAALADVALSDGKTYASPRISTRSHLAIGIKIESNLWRLILPYPENSPIALDKRVADVVSCMFSNADYEVKWKSEFKLHQRVSQKFQVDRVILAGDAAHLNSPVGGQGMNAGIQDTAKLARALCNALKNDSLEPLKSYSDNRRKEIVLGVNDFTDALTKTLLLFNGKPVKLILKTANKILQLKPLRKKLLRKVAMLG